jgi:hypothetical protein
MFFGSSEILQSAQTPVEGKSAVTVSAKTASLFSAKGGGGS